MWINTWKTCSSNKMSTFCKWDMQTCILINKEFCKTKIDNKNLLRIKVFLLQIRRKLIFDLLLDLFWFFAEVIALLRITWVHTLLPWYFFNGTQLSIQFVNVFHLPRWLCKFLIIYTGLRFQWSFVDQEVLRFYISMYNSSVVHVSYAIKHFVDK